MKIITRILLLFYVVSGSVHASTINPKIFSVPITMLNGETISLGQFKGLTPVYLKFWASWCQPCRAQMPHFQNLQKEYGDTIKMIAVNVDLNDSVEMVNKTKDEFGLTMPITMDTSGTLADAFNLIATPYNVLINKTGTIIYLGNDTSKTELTAFDKKIQLVATNKPVDIPDYSKKLSTDSNSQRIITDIGKKDTLLFFVATWCDWYLKESRPTMSKQCITAQKSINALYPKFKKYNWLGIAKRLYVGDKELMAYKKRFNIVHPIIIDKNNEVFLKYEVNDFPTLLLLKNGKEIFRVSDFNNQKIVSDKLEQYSSK